MQIHVYDNEAQVAKAAAALVTAQLLQKPDCVLGLATGASPIPTYQEMIRLCQEGVVDFSRVTSFNLDEYCRLPVENPCSYHHFMKEELFDHINVKLENTFLPDGNAKDFCKEGARYDAAIAAAGGVDLQLLGIGRNAHIGFNEPAEELVFGCHLTDLTPSTIQANRRFFDSEDAVPKQAITMGIGTIMSAKCVLLLATGADKAEAIRKTLREDMTPWAPASILRTHPNVIFLLDKAAAAEL